MLTEGFRRRASSKRHSKLRRPWAVAKRRGSKKAIFVFRFATKKKACEERSTASDAKHKSGTLVGLDACRFARYRQSLEGWVSEKGQKGEKARRQGRGSPKMGGVLSGHACNLELG